MKRYKQLLMSVAGLAILFGTVAVKAAETEGDNEFASKIASGENVVLFKIHDVKPIKNDDGVKSKPQIEDTIRKLHRVPGIYYVKRTVQ